MKESWEKRSGAAQCDVDLETNELDFTFRDDLREDQRAALRQAIEALLTPEFLEQLAAHRQYTVQWRDDNWWRYQDWTDLPEDVGVSWSDVYPMSEPFTFTVGNRHYAVEDGYCTRLRCDCRCVLLYFQDFGEDDGEEWVEGEDDPGIVEVGVVSIDAGKARPEIMQLLDGRLEEVRPLFSALVQAHPSLLTVVREREQVIKDFARFVGRQRRQQESRQAMNPTFPTAESLEANPEIFLSGLRRPPEPFRATPAVGASPDPARKTARNDPCPCGSGRKFKKCCGRSDR